MTWFSKQVYKAGYVVLQTSSAHLSLDLDLAFALFLSYQMILAARRDYRSTFSILDQSQHVRQPYKTRSEHHAASSTSIWARTSASPQHGQHEHQLRSTNAHAHPKQLLAPWGVDKGRFRHDHVPSFRAH
jgi:hypothetical protein